MMAVIQAQSPSYAAGRFDALPHVPKELCAMKKHVPEKWLTCSETSESFATLKDVVDKLPSMSAVHFSCHGQQEDSNPLESALILDDGPLKVSQIMKIPTPNASLAFLSACQTAMGDGDLPDEAMHLAASLLFSGFRSVVATMW